MTHSEKWFSASAEVHSCRSELRKLEEQAGISAKVNTANDYCPFPSFSEAPEGTEQYRKHEESSSKHIEDINKRVGAINMRNAYFSVSDISIRKELIALNRKLVSLHTNLSLHSLWDARASVEEARKSNENWPLYAAAVGLTLVGLGDQLFGVSGAIGGALASYFLGRFWEDLCKRQTEDAVKSARESVIQCEADYEEGKNAIQLFSRGEEHTGEQSEVAASAVWKAYGGKD